MVTRLGTPEIGCTNWEGGTHLNRIQVGKSILINVSNMQPGSKDVDKKTRLAS